MPAAEYMVQVHIIQALNLNPGAEKTSCIPLCECELWGQKQQTKKMKFRTMNPFWDKLFTFEQGGVDLDGGENALTLTVYDTDTWFSSTPLGRFVIDLAHVYNNEPQHEYYRQWCVLTDPSAEDEDSAEPTGFLKLSVMVMNITNGDQQPSHDEEDPFADPETDNAEDLESAMLKPPKLSSEGYHLHVKCWCGEDVKEMNWTGGVDPLVKMGFAGKKKLKTEHFTDNTKPQFKKELILKVGKKAPTDVIMLELWDYNLLGDSMISNRAFSYKKLMNQGGSGANKVLKPRWFPLYGHFEYDDLEKVLKDCFKSQQSEPERLEYRGRLLIGFQATHFQEVKAPAESVKSLTGGPQKPPELTWTLRFDLYQLGSVEGIEPGLFGEIFVEIQWGRRVERSRGVKVDDTGAPMWLQQLDEIRLKLPEVQDTGDFYDQGERIEQVAKRVGGEPDWGDWDQLPWVVIRLMKSGLAGRCIAYLRLHPAEIPLAVDTDPDMPDPEQKYRPQWHMMQPYVPRKKQEGTQHVPHFVQFRIGLNHDRDPAGVRERLPVSEKKKHVLRSHCFQARDLIPANRNGTSDPYVEVQCGAYNRTSRRNEETLSPLWYETLTGVIQIPPKASDLAQAPLINVSVYDWEQALGGLLSFDKIIGRGRYEILPELLVDPWQKYQPRKPEWKPLFDIYDGTEVKAGTILLSFDIMHPKLAKEPSHKYDPQLAGDGKLVQFVPMFLEYRILGLRDLESRGTERPPRGTKVRVKCGFAEWEDVAEYEWINKNKNTIGLGIDETALEKKKEFMSLPLMQTPKISGRDRPNGQNPDFTVVGYLKFNYPLDKRYMPSVVVECLKDDAEDTILGRFDCPLDEVLRMQSQYQKSKNSEDKLKLALEKNGIDPAAARAGGEKVSGQGAEVEMDDPGDADDEAGGEDGGVEEEAYTPEDEENAGGEKKAEGGDEGEEGEAEDGGSSAGGGEAEVEMTGGGGGGGGGGDNEEKEPEHEDFHEYPHEYEPEFRNLPYSRYDFQRLKQPAWDPFKLTFDRTPRVETCGIFKGTFRVLRPLECPGDELKHMLLTTKRSKLLLDGAAPSKEMMHAIGPRAQWLEFGDAEEDEIDAERKQLWEDAQGEVEDFLETELPAWVKPDQMPEDSDLGPLRVAMNINARKYFGMLEIAHQPLFWYGVDTKEGEDEDADAQGAEYADDDDDDDDDEEGTEKPAAEWQPPDISEIDVVPTTPKDRGGEVMQWFWDIQQSEWEDFFKPQEYHLRTYVYSAYYLVSKRANETCPIIRLEVPSQTGGEDWHLESYPAEGQGKTAWPMVLRTLSPQFKHTYEEVVVTLPGAGVCKMVVLDRDEGFFSTTETELGWSKFDVEDQIFDGVWKNWNGQDHQDMKRRRNRKAVGAEKIKQWTYYQWPTQERTLKSSKSKAPMGRVKMFVQVLTPEEAGFWKPINIKGPGPMDFELRTTVFGLRNVQPPAGKEGEELPRMCCSCLTSIWCFSCCPIAEEPEGIVCCPGGLNVSVEIRGVWCFPEAEEDRFPVEKTDVYKCMSAEDMSCTYNWRMTMPVTLPCKFHFIQLNVNSRCARDWFSFGADDCISENVFNMNAFFKRALEEHKGNAPVTIMKPAEKGGKWIKLTHPKKGEETMAEISLHMELISKDLIRRREGDTECLVGSEAWDRIAVPFGRKTGDAKKDTIEIKTPERPPVDFWSPYSPCGCIPPFGIVGYFRWCLYRNFVTIILTSILAIVLLAFIGYGYLKVTGTL
eukprot:TRINITY_DN5906_c1_g1_i1.p1 TRINITY_DN5906_c1_g1~~TRINITY_DN5906_c1_g1_i1.p1  ORF type:complete len:1767 (+),score=688.70 TRINITY_DN5906_c1_g1_i1:80-5302(+)